MWVVSLAMHNPAMCAACIEEEVERFAYLKGRLKRAPYQLATAKMCLLIVWLLVVALWVQVRLVVWHIKVVMAKS